MIKLLIVAGDPSGDEHAAALVQEVKKAQPETYVIAYGGPQLQKVSDEFAYSLVSLGGFGFWEPILRLWDYRNVLNRIKRHLLDPEVKMVIPVDFFGFNIHVARAGKQMGKQVNYYISPQVWASRPHRVQALKEAVSQMMVIFPFEKGLYDLQHVPSVLVRHPLTEKLPKPSTERDMNLIGLFPGSRPSVLHKHLPLIRSTVLALRQRSEMYRFVLFRPAGVSEESIRKQLNGLEIEISLDPTYTMRKKVGVALGVSGTVALENALLGIPMVVFYKLSALTYWIARRLIRIPYIALPNILAGDLLFPECIQDQAQPKRLADEVELILKDPARQAKMKASLDILRTSLDNLALPSAAQVVLESVNE